MIAKALPITERVELIDKREFAAIRFVETEETIMVPVVILTKYSDHTSVFSLKFTLELPNTPEMVQIIVDARRITQQRRLRCLQLRSYIIPRLYPPLRGLAQISSILVEKP